MTGSFNVFAELDRSVGYKVRFTDGSVVDNHGHRTVVFAVNGGDHSVFTDVFFITALKRSIINVD